MGWKYSHYLFFKTLLWLDKFVNLYDIKNLLDQKLVNKFGSLAVSIPAENTMFWFYILK
jgi:hypothetical protein